MPSYFKSPFASTFKNAVQRGVPCGTAVETIAKKTNKTPKSVFESLCKAGLCYKQKVNGQWIYWPCDGVPGPSTTSKNMQVNMWQCFVDWCIASGCCTPTQLKNCCGSQTSFMSACKRFFGKQVSGFTPVKVRKTTTNGKYNYRTRSTKTVGSRRTTTGAYGMRRTKRGARLRAA